MKILTGIQQCLIADDDIDAKRKLRDEYANWIRLIDNQSTNSTELELGAFENSNEFTNLVSDELREAYQIYERQLLWKKLDMANL